MSPLVHRLTALAALPAALLLVLAVAAPVVADASLVEANPDDRAVLATPPTLVTLRFNQGVDAGKSSFRLIGPDGEVGTGKAARDGGKIMTLDGLTLGPGEYTVKWTVGSQDGHLVRGTLSFTVLEPTPAPASPAPSEGLVPAPSEPTGATAAPATPLVTPSVATAAPTTAPEGSPGDATTDGTPAASVSGIDVLIPIVVGLLLVGGVGMVVLRRGRRT